MADEARIARRMRFLREGIAANFTIVCGEREWKVDKGILCAESEYFEMLCLGNFGEAAKNKVSFKEEEPEVVDQLLVFCYTNHYEPMAVLPKPDDNASSMVIPPQVIPQKRSAEDNHLSGNNEPAEKTPEEDRDAAAANWLPANVQPSQNLQALWETNPRLHSASKDDVTKFLRIAILTYAFAKMMDLTALVTQAASAFIDHECFWIRADIAQVLDAVFRSTDTNDDAVRVLVLTQCIANFTVLYKFPEAVEVIRKYERAAWDFSLKFKAETAEVREQLEKVNQLWKNEQRCNQRNIRNNAQVRKDKDYLQRGERIMSVRRKIEVEELEDLQKKLEELKEDRVIDEGCA